MNNKKYSPKYVIQLSRKLRLEMTDTEKILWNELRLKKQCGLRFRNQHPIGRYIADFYCHSHKLIVEVDGKIHDEQKVYDENRDQFLSAQGYSVLRFSNTQISENLSEVLSSIINFAQNKPTNASSPPPGDLGGK